MRCIEQTGAVEDLHHQPPHQPGLSLLAVADASEVVVQFEVDRVFYRLILPYGRRRFLLDSAQPDSACQGRPWIKRWVRFARGLRDGHRLVRMERTYEGTLSQEVLTAIHGALRYVDGGPAVNN